MTFIPSASTKPKKTVGSRTGKGFTLLEVLVTIAVVAFSFVLILPAFSRASSQLQYLAVRQEAATLLGNRLVLAEEHFRAHHHFKDWTPEGEFAEEGGAVMSYRLEPVALNEAGSLYEVQGQVEWELPRKGMVKKSIYVAE